MAEKNYAPLSAACVRSLNDNQKRKAAALEIEKMVKEFTAHSNTVQITRLIGVLKEFTASASPHTRKGGLIGMAATAIGLGKDVDCYLDMLIQPVLCCFTEPDSRIRYHACESLYNIVKVARGGIVPHFTDIFGALSKLACDTEQTVKNATEVLDRLMKDIVTESDAFDLEAFIPFLRERMYTKNPFGKMFIVSWIQVLVSVPDIDMTAVLPEILDGLFCILDDQIPEIKQTAYIALNDFLRNIKTNPSRVSFADMINILIIHAQTADEMQQLTALTWIDEFLRLSGALLIPYTSGIITAALPCLSYEGDTRRAIKETATRVNANLVTLITSTGKSQSTKDDHSADAAAAEMLNISSIVESLTKQLEHSHVPVQTKVAVLKWIYHLHKTFPDKMVPHIDSLFPVLMRVLSDGSEEVVQQCVVVISELISPKSADVSQNKYFTKFIQDLVRLFSTDRHLLEDRGASIVRELCILLDPEAIFKTLADTLEHEQNLRFACTMVQTLNIVLLTSSELSCLRTKLKNMNDEESTQLFLGIYRSWCHCPVATVALCLLTKCYKHAYHLVKSFGSENIEVTVEHLIEIDKLIQLVESPIFTYLRLELLEAENSHYLLRALYGLLMIIPQSEAFQLLHKRLTAIPVHQLTIASKNDTQKREATPREKIDITNLLTYFIRIQDMHKEQLDVHRISAFADG